MELEEFSKRLEGKDIGILIEKAKKEANELMLDQATATLALVISQNNRQRSQQVRKIDETNRLIKCIISTHLF